MTAAPQPQSQLTLRMINQRLGEHSLPLIGASQMPDVLKAGDRTKILRALNNMGNPLAIEYLKSVLQAAGIDQMPLAAVPPGHAEPSDEEPVPNQDDSHIGSQGSGTAEQDDRENFHVYGGKAALCFEVDSTRGGVPTVALDAATSLAPKKYDWGNKIRIQMTRAELPVVAAVLMGVRQRCEFKNHGPDNSKGFSMERQAGGKVFVKVFTKGVPIKAVPVDPADIFFVASLFLLQIRKACPWLDAAGVIALVQSTMQLDGV